MTDFFGCRRWNAILHESHYQSWWPFFHKLFFSDFALVFSVFLFPSFLSETVCRLGRTLPGTGTVRLPVLCVCVCVTIDSCSGDLLMSSGAGVLWYQWFRVCVLTFFFWLSSQSACPSHSLFLPGASFRLAAESEKRVRCLPCLQLSVSFLVRVLAVGMEEHCAVHGGNK